VGAAATAVQAARWRGGGVRRRAGPGVVAGRWDRIKW
jgi:hypothetical protein